MPFAIQSWKLTRTFDNFSLRDINLHVPVGALCAVLGVPGSGKTTLIKLLLGLENPDSGQRMIFGQDIALSYLQVRPGYAPQTNILADTMTVHDVLHYFTYLSGQKHADIREVQALLAAVRLNVDPGESVAALNVAERQRLHLAVALIGDPRLLLLDEPTAMLTNVERQEFLSLVRSIGMDKTVLYTTRFPSDVQYASDYLIILHEGQLIAQGPTHDLFENADCAIYHLTLQGGVTTVHDTLLEQSWVYSIEVQRCGESQRWIVCVGDEDQAERSLLRAVLADRSLRVLDFSRARVRLTNLLEDMQSFASTRPDSNI